MRALRQPVEPVLLRARIGARELFEQAEVVSLTDRTMVVEVHDPTVALTLSLAVEIQLIVDLGGGPRTMLTEPGRRAADNPSSRRVELVLRNALDQPRSGPDDAT